MKKINRRSGFTLPEILVTVTVVAVLAAVVVPAVTQYVNKGNAPATQSDLDQIRNAVTAFVADTRVYPVYLSDLATASAPAYVTAAGGSFHGPYLDATVSSVTGQTGNGGDATGAADGTAAFTSQGTGLVFLDTIVNNNSRLQLIVKTPSLCSTLAHLDSTLDDGVATAGNFTYGTGAFPFAGACTTTATGALVTLIVIGH